MITDSYSKMTSNIGMRSTFGGGGGGASGGNGYTEEELGLVWSEQQWRLQEASDRERQLSIIRSGSAPMSVGGSYSAATGGLSPGGSGGCVSNFSSVSEVEIRSDPAYTSYYYSNLNLNPHLPPPLLAKEDQKLWQQMVGGGGGAGRGSSLAIGGIGVNGGGEDGNTDRSLFSMQPVFSGAETLREWSGNGPIGFPRLGFGSRQKSIPEMIQNDMSQSSVSMHPSRPTSGHVFDGVTVADASQLTPDMGQHADLVSAFSGMSLLGVNNMMDQNTHLKSQVLPEMNELLRLQGDQNASSRHSYLNSYINGHSTPSLGSARSFRRELTVGPNLLASAAEMQSSGNSLHIPPIDPFYLPYLRSAEFASAQLAALNDPTINREATTSSYMEFLGLNKAYLEKLHSFETSQYGLPVLGESGTVNHGYFGDQRCGPVRHGEQNMSVPSGISNLSGVFTGSWHPEPGCNLDVHFASSFLDKFKTNKTKIFELAEIAGHIVEFSTDQIGSRFLQQKLETASTDEKNMVVHEIMSQALSLMTDVFGNYVIQKFLEHGSATQIRELGDQLTGHVLTLSLQMYGCRVIQKAIEVVGLDQRTKMVAELDGHVMRYVRDQNGNHVIQKCIECVPEDSIEFIVSIVCDQVVPLSTHPYGCRVVQRVLEYCNSPKTQSVVMNEILQSVCMLAQDQYGNYVVQHVLQHGHPQERSAIISKLTAQIVLMSQQKFASNVVEKCLTYGTSDERKTLVNEVLGPTYENEPLQVMMKDQFANYVVQKVLETCDDQQLELILERIKVHLSTLKRYTYVKHIVARVEKLVAAGERRISFLNST